MDPEEALELCREVFTEGEQYYDVRAGCVELDTLSAEAVEFVSDRGTRLPIGDATDLWESYQNGSIQPVDDKP